MDWSYEIDQLRKIAAGDDSGWRRILDDHRDRLRRIV
jgi:hypothetical protein